MADNSEISKGAGIIPDFFHDIIAYIIPGYTCIILFVINLYFINAYDLHFLKEVSLGQISLLFLIAYVIGRFFEQLGFLCLHNRKYPWPFAKKEKRTSAKWALIFDESNKDYTTSFKNTLKTKIGEWLKEQDGTVLLEECKNNGKDDYFNLIQFYCRERFPAVALYEKKQNATIVLTRSLALAFAFNILVWFITMICVSKTENLCFHLPTLFYIAGSILFSIILYKRYKLDQKYHAMYIFECFIGLKKLLNTKGSNEKKAESQDKK